jgi:putrescine aminotransferase
MTSLWRGMTNMAATRGQEVVIERGLGVRVWDEEGREYLDGTASLWYAEIGHGREEIAVAVAEQMSRISAFHTFDVYANRPALDLAERLAGLAPFPGAVVFFTPGGGSDAVDTAAKLARRYWHAVGQPAKRTLVSRGRGYHGMNAFGTSLGGIEANREGYGELIPETTRVAYDSVSELEALFEASAGSIAAFIGEPVIGAGGIYPPPEGYWPQVERLCRAHDVLLIADEVICGFGRLGTWFGCQSYGFTPDLMTCAKGLTSGYVPQGAVVAAERVAAPFWEGEDAPSLRHGYTYGGHPVACAAGLANLGIIEREGLVERVAEISPRFHATVREAFAGFVLAGEIRTAGLLAAVEVAPDALALDPLLAVRIAVEARSQGLITRSLGTSLQLSPAFVATEAELAEMVARLRLAFEAVVPAAVG